MTRIRTVAGAACAVACWLASPASAADLTVTDAAITGGRLVVTGTTAKASTPVTLDGVYHATSNAAKTFKFSLVYLPSDCIVDVTDANTPNAVQAVVANCGPRGVTPRGAWSASENYVSDDVVTLLGSVWRAKAASLNKPPNTHAALWEQFVAKGATGVQGPAGAQGPQGVQGAQGDTGSQGNQGDTGAQGDAGPQGSTGVVSTAAFTGIISPGLPSGTSDFIFIGPTATVAIADNQRVTGSMSAVLGTPAFTTTISIGICYSGLATGFTVVPFAGSTNSPTVTVTSVPGVYNNSSSFVLGSLGGSYTVGFCGKNTTNVGVTNDGMLNGWVIVTN